MTSQELCEVFPEAFDPSGTCEQKLTEYLFEREKLENELRFDLWSLKDVCKIYDVKTKEGFEASDLLLVDFYTSELAWLDLNIKRLEELLTFRTRPKDDSKITQNDIDGAKECSYESILASNFVQKGVRKWTICPFHADKNPSFCVDEQNRWKCWTGCGFGDTISLVMRLDGIGFISAVKKLLGGGQWFHQK